MKYRNNYIFFIMVLFINIIRSQEQPLYKYIEITNVEIINKIELIFYSNKNQFTNNNTDIKITVSNSECVIKETKINQIKCTLPTENNNDEQITILKINSSISQITLNFNLDNNVINQCELDCGLTSTEGDYCNTEFGKCYSFLEEGNEDDDEDGVTSTITIVIVIVVSIVGVAIIGSIAVYIFIKFFKKKFQQHIEENRDEDYNMNRQDITSSSSVSSSASSKKSKDIKLNVLNATFSEDPM